MKEYRSSIRSKRMIRESFIELLAVMPISKITVVNVVEKADISRNTFYAHYESTYAVMKDIEDSFISKLEQYMDQAVLNREIYDPLPLLQRIQHFIESDIKNNKLLLVNPDSAVFCEKLKSVFLDRLLSNLSRAPIKDTSGFLIFIECLASGFLDLYKKNLLEKTDMSLSEIDNEISRIFKNSLPLYC